MFLLTHTTARRSHLHLVSGARTTIPSFRTNFDARCRPSNARSAFQSSNYTLFLIYWMFGTQQSARLILNAVISPVKPSSGLLSRTEHTKLHVFARLARRAKTKNASERGVARDHMLCLVSTAHTRGPVGCLQGSRLHLRKSRNSLLHFLRKLNWRRTLWRAVSATQNPPETRAKTIPNMKVKQR